MLARRERVRDPRSSRPHQILVMGPPCSGKSTYVAEHKRPGDVVIDYDALAVALGSPDSHDHPASLRPVVLAAWTAAIRAATGRVWLVRGFPEPRDLADAAEVVRLEVDADVCKARAADQRPATWPGLIDSWWERYGPTA